jgi:cytochrome c oxidase assembly protein subunit 15
MNAVATVTPARAGDRFYRVAVGVLVLNIIVILWGALVRATGSGAGCGGHWPLCNGQVVPFAPAQATVIEYLHRLMSAAALVAVVALWIWSTRRFTRRAAARRWALGAMVLVFVEALVGAGLVLMEWVGTDASTGRVVSIAVHLIITYALLACLALTAWFARSPEAVDKPASTLWAALLVGGMTLVGITGAITALGDTLFPSSTLALGLAMDISPQAHFLLRLRVVHPLLAATVAIAGFLWAGERQAGLEADRPRRRLRALQAAFAAQVLVGIVNVVLLAPVWLQILHLLVADVTWILLVLCLAEGRVSANARAAAD